MSSLHRQSARRKQPARIMAGARVAVATLTNYCHGSIAPGAVPGGAAKVAQYAQSADYHRVLGRRLEQLAAAIRHVAPGAQTRVYLDAGPVPERELAQRAGLGWIAKNMMLIHPMLGSFTFIGVIFTDAPLTPDLPFQADRCGTCRRCLDACRSEEHTSELQSQSNLVCRLLLEKKKKARPASAIHLSADAPPPACR